MDNLLILHTQVQVFLQKPAISNFFFHDVQPYFNRKLTNNIKSANVAVHAIEYNTYSKKL